jgi:hypothetical protein
MRRSQEREAPSSWSLKSSMEVITFSRTSFTFGCLSSNLTIIFSSMDQVPLSGEHGDLGQDAEILSPGSASGCLMMTIGHEID